MEQKARPVYHIFFLLLTLGGVLYSPALLAQDRLTGRVLDLGSGAAIPFVTVYFDGTTIGTHTAEDGSFSLPLTDVALPAVLVATHLGYRSTQQTVESAGAPVVFRLSPAANQMAAVEVGDRNNREKNLEEFREHFLGTDEWGRRARIMNEDRLRFNRTYATDTLHNADLIVAQHGMPDDLRDVRWSLDGKSFTFEQAIDLQAHSTAPLELDLPDLGYRLSMDLLRFAAHYRQRSTQILGTYYFQPYEGNGKPSRRHARNREAAYYHSTQHFLQALYADRLDAEGYVVYEREGEAVRPLDLAEFVHPAGNDEKVLRGLGDREVVILYYGDRRGRPLPADRRKNRPYRTSYLQLHGPEARFRADGTTGDSPLRFGGSLGQLTVTRMLPSDYRPEE